MSHPEERSPKRQRRSYSPASPPVHAEVKSMARQESLPQTPPPSVHMSPSWQSQFGSGIGATIPTPPSTAGFMSQQMTERGDNDDLTQDSQQPTPAAVSDRIRGEEGDAKMTDIGDGLKPTVDATQTRRTDHDRDTAGTYLEAPKLYRCSVKPIAPSRPHASQNMISLYSLDAIQLSVARRDADGNKINKLRKSYENKVKALGLEGRSKAEVGSAALQGLLDPGWDMDIGDGRTAWQARSAEMPLDQHNSDFLIAKLGTALALQPGHLPKAEHETWKAVLGLDETLTNVARPATSNARVTTNVANPLTAKFGPSVAAATSLRASAPNSPRNLPRLDRANKKRRYDESSYTGYQEGYDDDGYSTGGGGDESRSGIKRQKRKDFAVASSQGGFNSNMVGVNST